MINMIKMDLYRMFRTKSLYVIWIIMAVIIIAFTLLMNMSQDMPQQDIANYQETTSEEMINIGMSVTLPTLPGEKATVLDCLFANMQGKIFALLITIFCVIFSTADVTSGYIKTIGGQIKNRQGLVISKAVSMTVYVILSIILLVVIQALSNLCILGYLKWGNLADFSSYLVTQTILHIALALICMAVAIILKNNVISMIIVVCLSANLMMVIYSGLSMILQKIGIKDFSIIEHTVTGKISVLSIDPSMQDCLSAILVAIIFGVVFTVIAGMVFKRRDI